MGIHFTKVSYRYPGWGRETYGAIADINLSISAKDEFIALVGHTGSGKSTLAQHMNALMFPTEGTVEIFGVGVTAKRNKKTDYNSLRKRVGLVFQFPEYQLFEETVEKDIMFGPRNFHISEDEAREMAKKALRLVGLPESYLHRNPFNLSGGEKKRVSITGILAMNPDVLVLDEPTSGLDPRGKKTLMELFRSIRKETGKTIVFITHDMDLVYQYADRVLVLEAGNLVFDGTPDRLFREPDLARWHLDYPNTLSTLDTIRKTFGWDIDIYQNTVEKAAEELSRAVRRS